MATQRPGISDPATRPLDVAMVLRRTLPAVFVDPVPVLGGLVLLVVLPGVVTRLVIVGNDGETLLVILRALLAMVYAAMVSPIIVARVQKRTIPLRAAIGRSTPGVQAALLLGAAVVAGMTLHLFARHGSVAGWLLDVLLLSAALLGASILMPLVPVAVIEALSPMAAMRRAAGLTSGNRNRILALALLAGLTLAPLAALAIWVPGLWGVALFEGAAWLIAALLPALVYAGLLEGGR
jgi:hypothetical protein